MIAGPFVVLCEAFLLVALGHLGGMLLNRDPASSGSPGDGTGVMHLRPSCLPVLSHLRSALADAGLIGTELSAEGRDAAARPSARLPALAGMLLVGERMRPLGDPLVDEVADALERANGALGPRSRFLEAALCLRRSARAVLIADNTVLVLPHGFGPQGQDECPLGGLYEPAKAGNAGSMSSLLGSLNSILLRARGPFSDEELGLLRGTCCLAHEDGTGVLVLPENWARHRSSRNRDVWPGRADILRAAVVQVESPVLDGGARPMRHLLHVPVHMQTAREAVAWTWGDARGRLPPHLRGVETACGRPFRPIFGSGSIEAGALSTAQHRSARVHLRIRRGGFVLAVLALGYAGSSAT